MKCKKQATREKKFERIIISIQKKMIIKCLCIKFPKGYLFIVTISFRYFFHIRTLIAKCLFYHLYNNITTFLKRLSFFTSRCDEKFKRNTCCVTFRNTMRKIGISPVVERKKRLFVEKNDIKLKFGTLAPFYM